MSAAPAPTRDELRALLAAEDTIPAARLGQALASDDPEILGAAARLLREHRDRFDAPLPENLLSDFARRYYARCLREDPQGGEFAEDRRHAAHGLVRWFFALLEEEPVPQAVLEELRGVLAELYRTGDAALRETIVAHCLEHLFESPRVVALFTGWEDDPALGEAYRAALEWGEGFWPRRYR